MKSVITVIVVLIIVAGAWVFLRKPETVPVSVNTPSSTTTTTTPEVLNPSPSSPSTLGSDSISISAPKANASVSSPITLSGQARGNWFFEATAPVMVMDNQGKTLGQGFIQATGDWMTTEFVPFTGNLSFSFPTGTSTDGVIVFMNDNPSGDPSRSISVRVPVKFVR
jgi:hypothetical protein